MGRYTGPKVKKSRRVRAPIAETPKHMKADTERGPGQHGFRRRRKMTAYAERLMEKQKLCFFYHVSDKQFRRYMKEAKRVRNCPLLARLDNRLSDGNVQASFEDAGIEHPERLVHVLFSRFRPGDAGYPAAYGFS